MSSVNDLPPALSSMWRALKRGYQAEPLLLSVSFGLALLAALPDALLALWLKYLADGVLGGHRRLAIASALGLGASAAATWFLRVISDRTQRHFRDKVTISLESHVAKLLASVATIEHHERPDYLDRLSVLRSQVFVLDHMYMSLFTTCAWILRLAVTIGLLVSIHPLLALLAIFALPTVLVSTWRPGVDRVIEESVSSSNRLARHLFDIATTPAPGKEVRVMRIGSSLVKRRREAWERWYKPVARERWISASWYVLGWSIFGIGYVAAVVFVATVLKARPSSVLLVLAAGARLSGYVAATVSEIGFLRGIWLDGSKRLAWLEDYAASLVQHTDAPAPQQIKDGISFEHVCFAYPGTDRLALQDVNIKLPPRSVTALVGENGAGKTTLVKLLCALYKPTSGRILVDGVDLTRVPPDAWRSRLAGAFQDFFRFELRARQSVGVGDLPRMEDEPAVLNALERAGTRELIDQLTSGLETQLGPSWPSGVEVSFGQWQRLAVARGFMRARPLVLILDEPTAALDAETEHALFERYSAAARELGPEGGITLLISHRFSTVRMADFIVVLDGSRVVESGTHESLLKKGGHYAELYNIQAAAYR